MLASAVVRRHPRATLPWTAELVAVAERVSGGSANSKHIRDQRRLPQHKATNLFGYRVQIGSLTSATQLGHHTHHLRTGGRTRDLAQATSAPLV